MVLRNDLRGTADQVDIILAIIDRLIDQIPELNSQTCYLTDQPIPEALPGGRYCVTVSIGPGQFPGEFFAGGGTDTLTEDGSIVVTPIVITHVDRMYRRFRSILGRKADHRVPSIAYLKKEILKALLAADWEPSKPLEGSEDDQVPLLRDMLSFVGADGPGDVFVGESSATAMQIRLSTVFDWDLS